MNDEMTQKRATVMLRDVHGNVSQYHADQIADLIDRLCEGLQWARMYVPDGSTARDRLKELGLEFKR